MKVEGQRFSTFYCTYHAQNFVALLFMLTLNMKKCAFNEICSRPNASMLFLHLPHDKV